MEVLWVNIPETSNSQEMFQNVEEYRRKRNIFVQIFDSNMVMHEEHLLWAFNKAKECFAYGCNVADSLEIEVLLWAAGVSQIKDALVKMGVSDHSDNAMVLIEDDTEDFLDHMGWERKEEPLKPSKEKLSNLGITKAEIDSVEDPFELVFEMMAASRL